jgi:apolipoprotein N-acyltransferase
VRPLLRRAAPAGATLASALLFGWSFPAFGWSPLAFVCLVPWLLALRAVGSGAAAGLGALWGIAAAWRIASPLPEGISLYFAQPPAVGWGLALLIWVTMAAPFTLGFALLYRWLALRPGPWLPLVAAAAWVASELGRGRLFTETSPWVSNPWGLLGYTQARTAPLVQIASALGVYGPSFVVAAANAGLAEAVLAWRRGRRAPRALLAPLAAPALLLLSAWLAGRALLAAAPADLPPGAVPVAIVQDDLDAGSRWRSALYGVHLETQLELTARALAQGRPAVVFWPESAMTFLVEREPLYRRAIARVLGPARAELLAGAPRAEGEGPAARYWNSVYLLAPSGEILGRYDKEHLVPFSERFPIRVERLRRRFGRFRELEPGAASPPLPSAAGRAGIVTCNEALLPEVVSRRVAAGATLLVNPAHDRWIADPAYGEMQLDVAVFRAAEQRRFLIRASTSGPSAVVDPWGRIQVRSAPLSRAVLQGRVAPLSGRTPYGRIGDAFALGCVALVTLSALISTRRPPGW